MTTKRQQTMAKMTRERAVREKREKKMEKKRAAAAERKLRAAGLLPLTPELDESEPSGDDVSSPALLDTHLADGDDGPVLGERVVPGL
jgi:hypothetical protein